MASDSLVDVRPAVGSTLMSECDGAPSETVEPGTGSDHAGGRTGELGPASAQCGRCGHAKSRHGGMPGPETEATERNNASRCGACEEAGVYCERWTPSYGPFPGGPSKPPTAEEWIEALTKQLVVDREERARIIAQRDAIQAQLAEVRASLPDIAAHSHGMGQECAFEDAANTAFEEAVKEARAYVADECDMWRDMYRGVAAERAALRAALTDALAALARRALTPEARR